MNGNYPVSIDVHTLKEMREAGKSVRVLDVRQPWEVGVCALDDSINIPLNSLPAHAGELPRDEALVVICHHGMRSQHAVAWLRGNGFGNAINLTGGIDAWARQIDRTMATY